MTDLISRDALAEVYAYVAIFANVEAINDSAEPNTLSLGEIQASGSAILNMIDDLPAVVPQVVANISGGVLQGASSDYPVDIHTLDFEIDSFDSHATGIVVDGDEAYLGQCSTKIDPTFVREVIEAPEVYFDTGEPT